MKVDNKTQPDEERDPVEELASEFMERLRLGEHPTVEQYIDQYPDHAAEIEEYFPAIMAMEQLKGQKQQPVSNVAVGSIKLERLGDFRLIREIGRGGMGIVFEAVQQSLGRQVAVKVLPSNTLHDKKKLQRFRREARTAAKLHHTNIVQVFGVGEDDGYHYFVMQLIRGVGLDEILIQLRAILENAHDDQQPELSEHRLEPVRNVVRALLSGQFHSEGDSTLSDLDVSNHSDVTNNLNNSASVSCPTTEMPRPPRPVGEQNGTQVMRPGDTVPIEPEAPPIIESSSDPASSDPASSDAEQSDVRRAFKQEYWRAIARIGVQVSDALHYAHGQGTLHRDIKPANLLLDGRGVVWVADFGLAKALEQDDVSKTGDIVGTLRYMAPEQFSGEADLRSDIYSLGLTLYELLTLRPAHEDKSRLKFAAGSGELPLPSRPRALNPAIPRDLETIVLKAMAHEPRDRYENAEALSADLRRYLEDRPILAKRASTAERFIRWCRRNPAVSSLSMLSVVLLALIAFVASAGYVHTNQALIRESDARQQAEATLGISLAALDRVYLRFFAPDRHSDSPRLAVQGPDGEELEVLIEPVLSKETLAFLEDLLGFYNKFAQQDSDNVILQAEAAKAIRRVGDIRRRLGDYEQAIEAYETAVDRYQKLAALHPDDSRYQTEEARAINELGGVYFAQREFTKADETFGRARTILEGMVKEADVAGDVRFELARTYYALGRRRETGRPMGPRFGPPGFATRPLGGRPGLGRQEPGRGRLLRGRGGRGRPPGSDDFKRGGGGKRPEARPPRPGPPRPGPPDDPPRESYPQQQEHLKRAVALLEQLREEDPAEPRYRRLLAVCLRDLNPQTHPNGAKDALEILEALQQEYPNIADYRFELSVTYAAVDPRRDPIDEVEGRLRKAVDYSQQLVREHPNEPMYAEATVQMQHRLGMTLLRRAMSLTGAARAAQLQEAKEQMQSAQAGQTSIVERYPDAWSHLILLSHIAHYTAQLHLEANELAPARKLIEDSISRLEKYLANHKEAGFLHVALFESNSSLADIGRRMGPAGIELQREALKKSQLHRNSFRAALLRSGGGLRGLRPPGRGWRAGGPPPPPAP